MKAAPDAMLSAYFSYTGCTSIGFLPQGQKDNSQFSSEITFPSLDASLPVSRPKQKATDAQLPIDNAKPPNFQLSCRKTEEYGFIPVPRPPYSPDLTACNFFLFGYLKSQLEGKTVLREENVKRKEDIFSWKVQES
jgi:hypothetical protein